MSTRPWPTPGPGDLDFIIRDPAELERIATLASQGDFCAKVAVHWHFIARDADDAIEDVLQRWRDARAEAGQ